MRKKDWDSLIEAELMPVESLEFVGVSKNSKKLGNYQAALIMKGVIQEVNPDDEAEDPFINHPVNIMVMMNSRKFYLNRLFKAPKELLQQAGDPIENYLKSLPAHSSNNPSKRRITDKSVLDPNLMELAEQKIIDCLNNLSDFVHSPRLIQRQCADFGQVRLNFE